MSAQCIDRICHRQKGNAMFAVFVMLEILPISYLKTTQKAHIANNQVRWRMANPSLLLLQRYIFLPTWRPFISTFLEVSSICIAKVVIYLGYLQLRRAWSF